VDDKSLELLEFPRIREIIARFTSFSASRELALGLEPVSDHRQVSLRLRQSAEARYLLSVKPELSLDGVRDVRQLATEAAQGKQLDSQALLQVQGTVVGGRRVSGVLTALSRHAPLLCDIAADIVELPRLEDDISRCISPAADVLDSASSRLADIRRDLVRSRTQLVERLQSIVRSARGRRILSEPIVTEREGRYVLPVKVERRREIKGIVHDVSNSGATVFVEPWATLELGNRLRELVTEERREIERILGELSAQVGSHETEIHRNVTALAEIDLALAKARYAYVTKAVEPELQPLDGGDGEMGQRPVLRLIDAKHPLLGERAVPLTVEIGRDFTVLVVTGPNTGGKTVALKNIGLFAVMAQSGLPVPASERSCLPVFDGIYADIGDEQSIENTLSTFSWHMSNILRILAGATGRSLVLLDELGTSTDPAEGSALARAILLHFLSRGCITAATTHYGELKTFAHTTAGLQNASLDFDPVTLTPTYHLTVGIPGGSNALSTAARLGLPSEIIDNAREMLPRGVEELESLLASLSKERQSLEGLRRELEQQRADIARKNAELEGELTQFKADRHRMLQETRDSLAREAAALHRDIRSSLAELRRGRSRERIERAKQTFASVQQALKSEKWMPPGAEEHGQSFDKGLIAEGDTVRLKEANIQAPVISVSEETQQVEVRIGQTRLWIGLDGVEKVVAAPASEGTTRPWVKRETKTRVPPRELDLRGRRAEEVEWEVERYLNEAASSDLREIRIIHGFGTGTVRAIVREFVSGHPLVESHRPGKGNEGGDGVTIVSLRG
jgi:DNA mismatch repair protein MutS2